MHVFYRNKGKSTVKSVLVVENDVRHSVVRVVVCWGRRPSMTTQRVVGTGPTHPPAGWRVFVECIY